MLIGHVLAVVIITIGREGLLRAVRSIFSQNTNEPIQILIGVDKDSYQSIPTLKSILKEECPSHITLTWLELGYSTSIRHGGVHASFYGGSLRSALALLANAPLVTFLDDDDWLLPDHCSHFISAFRKYPTIYWAHSLCYYADGNTSKPLCIDEIESVGVNEGIYKERFGGFVRLSGLTIDIVKVLPFIHHLAQAMTTSGDGEDRLFFHSIKELTHIKINYATVCCALDPKDSAHQYRMRFIQNKIGQIELADKKESSR